LDIIFIYLKEFSFSTNQRLFYITLSDAFMRHQVYSSWRTKHLYAATGFSIVVFTDAQVRYRDFMAIFY
jgi:hypothetical protein